MVLRCYIYCHLPCRRLHLLTQTGQSTSKKTRTHLCMTLARTAITQGGKPYSIDAVLVNAFAATSRQLRRKPEVWPLVSFGGPGVRWQDTMEFTAEVLGELANGCKATLATPDGDDLEEVRTSEER